MASMPLPVGRWSQGELILRKGGVEKKGRGEEGRGSHLLQDDALGVGGALERLLPLVAEMALLVGLVCPPLGPAVVLQLPGGSHTTCLPATILILASRGMVTSIILLPTKNLDSEYSATSQTSQEKKSSSSSSSPNRSTYELWVAIQIYTYHSDLH